MKQFANEGGKAILTADTDFFRKPNQIVAIDQTGLKVVHLPSKWVQVKLIVAWRGLGENHVVSPYGTGRLNRRRLKRHRVSLAWRSGGPR